MFSQVSSKPALASKPVVLHHAKLEHAPQTRVVIETRATKEVTCKVMVAVSLEGDCLYRVSSAVQYMDGDKFYGKETNCYLSLADALRAAYGLSRKLYKVTASRALAGLLHDSVVPATDDINC